MSLRALLSTTAMLIAAAATPAKAIAGECNTTGHTIYRVPTKPVSTSSTNWSNVPLTNIEFTNDVPGCAFVRFSAETGIQAHFKNDAVAVAVEFDGRSRDISPRDQIAWLTAGDSGIGQAVSFEWIIPDLQPGTHKVQVRWIVKFGSTVTFADRVLTVTY